MNVGNAGCEAASQRPVQGRLLAGHEGEGAKQAA